MSYQDDYKSDARGNQLGLTITVLLLLALWLTFGGGECWRPGP
jgi:hypothetical protein